MDIDLNDYAAGGYLIVKAVPRPEYMSPDLLPARIISLSWCFCPNVQVAWGWDIKQYQQDALDFGIPTAKLPDFAEWGRRDSGAEVGHPNIFYSLDTARRFIAQFLPTPNDVVLVGIGLHRTLVDDFLATCKQFVYDANRQVYLHDQKYGVNLALSRGETLAADGQILGFEVVSYQYHLGHSWLCSGLQRDMFETFGIRPNANGLIATYDEAKQVYEWIREDEQQGTRAEPEPYYPWLIVRYAIP